MIAALVTAMALGSAAHMQQEPTPFWVTSPAEPSKKSPVQLEPLKMKRTKPPKRMQKGAPAKNASFEPVVTTLPAIEPARAVEPAAPSRVRVMEVPLQPGGDQSLGAQIPLFPLVPEPQQRVRRSWSISALGGGWAKARSDGIGHDWDPAWGLRGSRGILRGTVELELQLVRSGGGAGNPFASATTTHNLFAARGAYVYGPERWQLLAGGGAAFLLTQVRYTLRNVAATPTGTLDASGPGLALQLFAAARLRFSGGLEGRLEVDSVVRDGRIEWMPLVGAGAAF